MSESKQTRQQQRPTAAEPMWVTARDLRPLPTVTELAAIALALKANLAAQTEALIESTTADLLRKPTSGVIR
jgi:hypothetical protein